MNSLPLIDKRLAPHDPAHGQPFDRADGGEDQHDVALEDRQQEDDEEDEGQGIEHVDDAHHEVVDAPAQIAGDGAPGDPDEEADGGGDDADQQRDAQADQQAGEQVTALQVGAEDVHVLEGRRDGAQVRDGAVVVHPDHRPDDGDQRDEAE
jgi:hypothetical protein